MDTNVAVGIGAASLQIAVFLVWTVNFACCAHARRNPAFRVLGAVLSTHMLFAVLQAVSMQISAAATEQSLTTRMAHIVVSFVRGLHLFLNFRLLFFVSVGQS